MQAQQDRLEAIHREIAHRVGPSRYDLWFRSTAKLSLQNGTALVAVPNAFFQEWLSKHFKGAISEAVQAVLGRTLDVQFEVRPDIELEADEAVADRPDRAERPPEDREEGAPAAGPARGAPRPQPTDAQLLAGWATLQEFVVGACNRLAHASAVRFCEPSPPWRTLTLHGDVGLGKTHLLQGICRALAAKDRHLRVVYLTAEEFTNEFVTALRGGGMPSFRKRYRGVDVLAVDDLQVLVGKRATQEEFLHTFDFLVAHGRRVVVAIAKPLPTLALADALLTRLQAGMVCKLESPDVETRLAILRAKAALVSQPLPDDVLEFVAESFRGSVRELEGAFHRLRAHRELLAAPLDRPRAQEALSDLLTPTTRMVRLQDVEQAVCEVFGLEPQVLRSPVRHRGVSHPRMLAMYLARKYTRAAYREIGSYFGGRNYSTVIAAEKKVRQWLKRQADVEATSGRWLVTEAMAALERELRAG